MLDQVTAPPPAAGMRAAWRDLPANLVRWVTGTLGSPVVEAASQAGGFSPGVAARLVCRDGNRAFVKAVSADANPDSPGMHRHEAHVLAELPDHPALPRLLDSYDDGTWVALLFADVQGRQPRLPWRTNELRRVLDTLTDLATVLDPSPVAAAPDLAGELAGMAAHWQELTAAPPADLDPWLRARLPELVELGKPPAPSGSSLVHLDVRADNILLTPDGGVRLLDWANAGTGPSWLDLVVLLLEVRAYGGHDTERIVTDHPLTRDVDPALVTWVITAFAGMFQDKCRRPAPPGLPTIRDFQRAYARVGGNWLQHRLGG